MGSGAGGFVRITLNTLKSMPEDGRKRLHRVSELVFDVEEPPKPELPKDLNTAHPGPAPGPKPAGKLGLGGVRPGDVERFNLFGRNDDDSLLGLGVTRDTTITRELCDAFGGRWAGYTVSVAPTGVRLRLVADITLKPRWQGSAVRPFQIIPVVMTFGKDTFANHHLLAVIVAQDTVEAVGTSVLQPYR
jgi:hypothetical protein